MHEGQGGVDDPGVFAYFRAVERSAADVGVGNPVNLFFDSSTWGGKSVNGHENSEGIDLFVVLGDGILEKMLYVNSGWES